MDQYIDELIELEFYIEDTGHTRGLNFLFELAYQKKLGINDTTYVELALAESLPLATLDKSMIRVARSLEIPLFLEQNHWKDYTPTELVDYLKTSYTPFPELDSIEAKV